MQTSEIHGPRWYGTDPANLSYPDVTLYEAVPAAAGATPKAIAWDFMDTTQTHVVLKDGQPATPAMEEELIGYGPSQLIEWSCPRSLEFPCELPGTRSGNVDYGALVDGKLQ